MKNNEMKRAYAFEVFSKMISKYDLRGYDYCAVDSLCKELANNAILVTNQIFDAFKEESGNEK